MDKIISTASPVVALLGLSSIWFSIVQMHDMYKATTVSTYQAVSQQILDFDKIMIQYPQVRPYIYGHSRIDPSNELYPVAASVAEMQLDLLDGILWNEPLLAEHKQLEAWRNAASDIFVNSPLMWERLRAFEKSYSEATKRAAAVPCAPADGAAKE